jgi:hypothetical protein
MAIGPVDEPAMSEDELRAGIASVLGLRPEEVTITGRRAIEAGTRPKEVVGTRTSDAHAQFLCKHGSDEHPVDSSRRRGVAFEADVYRRLLPQSGGPAELLVGTFPLPGSAMTLVLRYLDDAVRLSEAPPETVVDAAAWLGAFHARTTGLAVDRSLQLHEHGPSQMRTWAARAAQFSNPLHDSYPWLPAICERVIQQADQLLPSTSCVLHGEYTVHNVLVNSDAIVPVDWESTGVGPGEIDLAMLLENWPEDVVDRCFHAYCEARYGACTPGPAQRAAFTGGRLYATLRWLGDSPALATRPTTRWRFHELQRHAADCGLT